MSEQFGARFRDRIRARAGGFVVDNLFRGMARIGRLHPQARREQERVEVRADVPYRDTGMREHRLDIYRPRAFGGRLPIVLYVHGGGFRILSKDTHWLMGLAFARRGYLVFNINYRLAPRYPFPAAIEDACAAFEWVVKSAAEHGGDLSRLVIAGESAGANLTAALTLATTFDRPEKWARAVFDCGVVPKAVVPACGIFQVTDVDRFNRRKPLPAWLFDRLVESTVHYLRDVPRHDARALDLADPLVMLERDENPLRPLPPFYLPVGTADPLLDDTRRMKAALDRRGVVCDASYFPGEPHAFHALVFREAARRCWAETFEFLDRHVPSG